MLDFKDALSSICPIPYSSVPSQNDELSQFLKRSFQQAELILNSIPSGDSTATSFHPAPANSATNASETVCDQSSVPLPSIPGRDPELQRQWGKPIKLSAKDNPLGVAVFKMAAHDRHGAFFARRSVHQGIGIEKFRAGMQREFLHSLKVSGGPGSGAVRGVAADRRLLKKHVDGAGSVEVWQTSSAFPGPVTPRESLTLVITTDDALSESSTPSTSSKPPRHHLIISRPTVHTSAPDRPGLVKLAYESAELVREIRLPHVASSGDDVEGASHDPEANPVEWLMITRSDPGGGIPKFMVERGTPGSIVADVAKWLNWATALTDADLQRTGDDDAVDEAQTDAEIEQQSLRRDQAEAEPQKPVGTNQETANEEGASEAARDAGAGPASELPNVPNNTGIVSKFTEAFGHAVADYMPYALQNHQDEQAAREADDDDDAAASTTSSSSAHSAESGGSFASAITHSQSYPAKPEPSSARASTDAISSSSSFNHDPNNPDANSKAKSAKDKDQHARELAKLHAKRLALETKRQREMEAATKKAAAASEKTDKDAQKAAERHERERRKQEERYAREMEKLERKREKEVRAAEEKRRKAEAKDELARARRERDEWKVRADVGEREAELLAKQVERLQKVNTSLVAGLGELQGGREVLARVGEENRAEERQRPDSKARKDSGGQGSNRDSQKSGQEQ